MQDGHSFGEQALYDALWQNARPYDKDTRIISIGYTHISELARLTINNCKANLRSLVEKLAIAEHHGFSHSQARTYLIYGYASILQRRRDAGLTHYVKSRGVCFVDPSTGAPLRCSGIPLSGIPFSKSGIPESRTPNPDSQSGIPEAGTGGVPESGTGGIPVSGIHSLISNSLRKQVRNTTTTVPPELTKGLENRVPGIDADAAQRIWKETGDVLPDRTADEVLALFDLRAPHVFRNRNLNNPLGVMLTSIKAWFTSQRVLEMRDRATREAEETAKILQELQEFTKGAGN